MEQKKWTREECLSLLQERKAVLQATGEDRFPRRDDFSEDEVAAIKAFLGPWPRALEAAGIKQASGELAQKKLEKRIRAKRRRTAQKLEKQQMNDHIK